MQPYADLPTRPARPTSLGRAPPTQRFMLSIGARVVAEGLTLDIVDAFLTPTFEGGRHAKRVEMIAASEG